MTRWYRAVTPGGGLGSDQSEAVTRTADLSDGQTRFAVSQATLPSDGSAPIGITGVGYSDSLD
ncbi:hypothetical protein CCR95_23065 [Thiocystis minor]|nr:hypothetical protein [Thiocystis minor]